MGARRRTRRDDHGATARVRAGSDRPDQAQVHGHQSRPQRRQIGLPEDRRPVSRQAGERARPARREGEEPDPLDPVAVAAAGRLVLGRQRHLKWRALDWLERVLMIGCGLALAGFSITVCLDIVTRTAGRPWLWLQEVTSTLF